MLQRTQYVIDDDGWDNQTRVTSVRLALELIAPAVVNAECDIPWHNWEEWPTEVRQSAELLRDRFVPASRAGQGYLQTGVNQVDSQTRIAFTTFAPFAYDSTFWGREGVLASVNDEGTSCVVALTDEDADRLRLSVDPARVVPLSEWRERHPSLLKRLLWRLTRKE